MVLVACSDYEEGSLTIVRLPATEVGNRVRGVGCRYRIVDNEFMRTTSESKVNFNVTDCEYILTGIKICMENCVFLRQAQQLETRRFHASM